MFARFLRFWRPQTFEVFHHDSPGMRVYVRRGPIRRALFHPDFSMDIETHVKLKPGETFVPLSVGADKWTPSS